jgi:hypothetical protein
MAESRGEVPKGTAAKWEAHTPKNKHLPEHVKKAFLMDIRDKLKGGTFTGEMLRTMAIDIPLDIVATGGGYLLGKRLKFPKVGATVGYLGGYMLPTVINVNRMTKKAEFVMKKLAQNLPVQPTSRWGQFVQAKADSIGKVSGGYWKNMPWYAKAPAKITAAFSSDKTTPRQAMFRASANRGFVNTVNTSGMSPGLKDTTSRAQQMFSTGENMVKNLTDNPPGPIAGPKAALNIKSYVKENKPFMDAAVNRLSSRQPALYNEMVVRPYNTAFPKDTMPEVATPEFKPAPIQAAPSATAKK